MSDYYLKVLTADGKNELATIRDFISLDYARKVNDLGEARFILPPNYADLFLTGDDVRLHTRVLVYRSYTGGLPYLDMEAEWLVYKGAIKVSEKGEETLELMARDPNWLLLSRIVAYAAASAQAEKNDFADDMVKAIVRENLGTLATVTARDLSDYLSVQVDLSLSANVQKAFARRKVLYVCQEIANKAALAGNYLAFDIVSTTPGNLEFRTYSDQRGNDHRQTSAKPVLIGRDFGNMENFELSYSHDGEITYCYAGGLGVEGARVIGTASDSGRIGYSPFNRVEYFADGLNTDDVNQLDDEAEAVVRENIPVRMVSGDLTQTNGFVYGLHFKWGDYLTISDRNQSFDARLLALRVKVRDGQEFITARLKAD